MASQKATASNDEDLSERRGVLWCRHFASDGKDATSSAMGDGEPFCGELGGLDPAPRGVPPQMASGLTAGTIA